MTFGRYLTSLLFLCSSPFLFHSLERGSLEQTPKKKTSCQTEKRVHALKTRKKLGGIRNKYWGDCAMSGPSCSTCALHLMECRDYHMEALKGCLPYFLPAFPTFGMSVL